jgi:holin-like protein
MLRGFAILLLFQLAGEVIARVGDLPVPGPVVGMVLLLAALQLRLPAEGGLREGSGAVLGWLSLLFVPAGVGIIRHLHRLSEEWPALAASLLVSTAATLAVTAWVAQRLSRRLAGGEGA